MVFGRACYFCLRGYAFTKFEMALCSSFPFFLVCHEFTDYHGEYGRYELTAYKSACCKNFTPNCFLPACLVFAIHIQMVLSCLDIAVGISPQSGVNRNLGWEKRAIVPSSIACSSDFVNRHYPPHDVCSLLMIPFATAFKRLPHFYILILVVSLLSTNADNSLSFSILYPYHSHPYLRLLLLSSTPLLSTILLPCSPIRHPPMVLILEPQGGYQPNPEQPSRSTILRHPTKPLVLEVTPDDGNFYRLKNREQSKSPPPIRDCEPKSPTTTFTRRMRKKGSLFAELVRGSIDDNEKDLPAGDGEGSPTLEVGDDEEELLVDDEPYPQDDDLNRNDLPLGLSSVSTFSTSLSTPATPTLLPKPVTSTEASLTTPAKLASALNLESARLEISLLALVILVLVAQMGALVWIGVSRRQRSAQWHQKERQQHISEDHSQDQGQDAAANHSSFPSTARLLLQSSLSGCSSGGQGLDTAGIMPAFLKKTKEKMGADSAARKNRCLFDEDFPSSSSSACSIRNALDLQESNPLGGGGTGYHRHSLVLGPPTVIPVSIPLTPNSSSSSPTGAVCAARPAISLKPSGGKAAPY